MQAAVHWSPGFCIHGHRTGKTPVASALHILCLRCRPTKPLSHVWYVRGCNGPLFGMTINMLPFTQTILVHILSGAVTGALIGSLYRG